jgi:predicted Zn-dependent protease
MKHWIVLAAIVVAGVGAIAISERRKVEVPAGSAAILYLVADTEQELTRMPVRFTRMSDAEEIAIGNEIARTYNPRELVRQQSVEIVENYLTQVGTRLAAHASRKLPYSFHYVPQKYFVNAFALPGGHIYVGQGLLALMDSEDELASVMGHEIEHVDHYHCAERVQIEQALRKLPFGELAALPAEIFQAGYSKDQELEADREGTQLAVAAGYSASGAIRLFEMFQRIEEATPRKSRNPGEELSDVAQQMLEGYFRTHPLPSERIAQIRKLIATQSWPVRAERDLAVAYIFWAERAADLYEQHRYPEAQSAALRTLKVQPDLGSALGVLAKAQFAQADFADSAATYRRLLQQDGGRAETAQRYALALAAADKMTAATEFNDSVKATGKNKNENDLRPSRAGLALLAGNAAPAKTLMDELHRSGETPEQLGELGWWYYLAADYATSLKLVEDAFQQRPGEPQWLTNRAWIKIQQNFLADALQTLASYTSGKEAPDRVMARAVAFWLSAQKDAAIGEFATAVTAQPEWKNPRWVEALYSPLVADTVQQMQAEQERRHKQQQAKLNGSQ